uniref:Ig-like domain-containing protein n=1 Tax=Maricaulis sp. TaxID=1486257 RepID=UPI002601C5F3
NGNTAATQLTVDYDATAPGVAISSGASGTVGGPFSVTIAFTEDVTGFAAGDIAVGNGAASDFSATSASVYTATITPAADDPVTVDVASGAAQDAAGNDSTAADQFSIGFDGTPPGLTISLPGSTAEGPFTATFTFSEAVSGFGLDDIATTNATVSGLSEAGEGEYTATFTPETVGEVAIAVAAGAATDSAGNESESGSASIEIVIPEVEVDLDLNAAVLDATTVSQTATLANPGSQSLAFVANADVDWVTVTPSSGTIPASGSIGITVTLNERAEQLEPGNYTGTVTVSTAVAAGQASTGRSEKGSTVVATIPITASVAERYGTLQIIATTPGGQQGDETFTYVSSDDDLNGLSLTTSGGLVASQAFRKVFGAYDLTQNLPQGWVLDSVNCSGDADGGSIIDVEAGTVEIDLDAAETIVCTFANTRDEDAIRLATMRAINNFMVRRADRIMTGAPDLSSRLRDRQSTAPGRFSADVEGGNVMMNFAGSLSGLRNHAKANERQIPGSRQTAEPDETRFDVWFAASYSALEDDRAGDRAESSFGLVQLGADWLVSENALVGVMVQVDEMSETAEDPVEAAGAVRGAELDGTGWMAGPYAVWEFADSATLDVSALWGQSDNTINPLGFYEDEFETTRYMVRANVTGEWKRDRTDAGQLVLRPGLSWTHFEETQDAYTDSLNIAIPEQTISIGRIEAGPEVAYRMDSPTGQGWWEPRAALRAVWDYDGADLMDESGRRVDDGQLRADLSIGLHGRSANGAVVSAEARISGLGDGDFSANTARIELRLPF